MAKDIFDVNKADSQATAVRPISPKQFDFAAYEAYEASLRQGCEDFSKPGASGVLVYRRMRVAEVFSAGSRSMEDSLAWQLGALEASRAFKGDIPNFLEPWYGLGTVTTAFGCDYLWEPGQAPAVDRKFASTEELLAAPFIPVAESAVGKHTLKMIDYFMEQCEGRLPMSYSDVQSPLNILSNLVEINQFFMDFYMAPEAIEACLNRIGDLLADYTRIQDQKIGKALVKPGHGFASCRSFKGIGMSDDTMVMLPPDLYTTMAIPSMERVGDQFGGSVFHSCGNWSGKREEVRNIRNLRMADGAFSKATDPDANPPEGFADTFCGTDIILNARIVGGVDIIRERVEQLWRPGMKLIVVTYCTTPQEQEAVHDVIHSICK